MRGFQCLLLCALLYLASVDAFGICVGEADDESCPDNATCEDENNDHSFECECKEGFDEIDVPGLTIDSKAVTVCVGMKIVIRYLKIIDGDLYMFFSETIFFSCEDCIRSVMFSNE